MNGDETVTLYTVQIWWREVPDTGDGSSSLINNVRGVVLMRDRNVLQLDKANGDTSYVNLDATQLVNIVEKKQ